MRYDTLRTYYNEIYEALTFEGREIRKRLAEMDTALIHSFGRHFRRRPTRHTLDNIERDIFGCTMSKNYVPKMRVFRKEPT